MKAGYVYILTNKPNGTLYIGVTSDLKKRIWEHKNKVVEGFSEKYDLTRLVWYEVYEDISEAILREKRMKKWERSWKLKRIHEMNPDWDELYDTL